MIAVKPGQLVLIQVKSGTAQISGSAWNDLYRLARSLRAWPVVADWSPRRPVVLRRITALHMARSPHWPAARFVLDEIDAAIARHPAKGTTDGPPDRHSHP